MSVLADARARTVTKGRWPAWTTTYHAATPGYFDESFRLGTFYFPKAQVFGGVIAVGVADLPAAAPIHLARGRSARCRRT